MISSIHLTRNFRFQVRFPEIAQQIFHHNYAKIPMQFLHFTNNTTGMLYYHRFCEEKVDKTEVYP